jgi:hypothetical protein
VVPVCKTATPREPTHETTIAEAKAFFARTLGAP